MSAIITPRREKVNNNSVKCGSVDTLRSTWNGNRQGWDEPLSGGMPPKPSWGGPRIEIDDAYIGGERTGEGAGRGRRGHTPFIIAVETSADGRPLHARLTVLRRSPSERFRRETLSTSRNSSVLPYGPRRSKSSLEVGGEIVVSHAGRTRGSRSRKSDGGRSRSKPLARP